MDYTPKPWNYLLSAVFLVAGILLAQLPSFGIFGLAGMTLISLASVLFVTVSGFWMAKGNYWRDVARLAASLPGLTPEEKALLCAAAPEIGWLIREGRPRLVLASTSVCPAEFLEEFLEKSDPVATWSERDIEGTPRESREIRRRRWRELCHWLYSEKYLVSRPSGQDSWLWRGGAWRELYSMFIGSIPEMESANEQM